MSIVAHGFLGFVGLFWAGALARAVKTRGTGRFRVRPEDPGPTHPARLAVVIPARNEVDNIGPCVASVLAQDHPDLRCFVLDDGSTDGTDRVLAVLLEEHPDRLTVLKGGDAPLPEGWYGKPWACQRAAEQAIEVLDPDFLLFVDADVQLTPGAARAALGYAEREGLAMLSGFGRLEMRSFWEKVMQPVVAGMIIAGNPLSRNNDPEKRKGKPIANGQFILLRRSAYDAVGGHAAVKDDVLDDVGMATAITGAELPYHMTFMTSLFSCRMYAGFADLWEGWSKNLFPGLGWSWGALVGLIVFTLMTTLLPYAVLLAGLVTGGMWLAWGVILVGLVQGLRLYLDRAFSQDAVYGVTHGPATVLLLILLVNSAIRTTSGTATWKGRTLSVGAAQRPGGNDST